jgi:hypothetical protein
MCKDRERNGILLPKTFVCDFLFGHAGELLANNSAHLRSFASHFGFVEKTRKGSLSLAQET